MLGRATSRSWKTEPLPGSLVGRAMLAHDEDGSAGKKLEREIEGGGETRRPDRSPA